MGARRISSGGDFEETVCMDEDELIKKDMREK